MFYFEGFHMVLKMIKQVEHENMRTINPSLSTVCSKILIE